MTVVYPQKNKNLSVLTLFFFFRKKTWMTFKYVKWWPGILLLGGDVVLCTCHQAASHNGHLKYGESDSHWITQTALKCALIYSKSLEIPVGMTGFYALKLIGVFWVLEAQPSGSRRPFLGPLLLRRLHWSLSLETLQLSHGGNPLVGSLSIGRQMRFSWKMWNWLWFPWKKPVLSLLTNPL